MKKIILIFSFSIAITLIAQDVEKNIFKNIKLGVKAGSTIGFIPSFLEEIKENSPRVGNFGGLYAMYHLNHKFVLQLEALYTQHKSRNIALVNMRYNGVDIPEFEAWNDFQLDYINIPLLLKWNFYDGFSMGIGGQIGFLQYDKATLVVDTYIENVHIEFTETGDFEELYTKLLNQYGITFDVYKKKFEYGILLDAEYRFLKHLIINMRYYAGLSTFLSGADIESDVKQSVMSVGLGYTF